MCLGMKIEKVNRRVGGLEVNPLVYSAQRLVNRRVGGLEGMSAEQVAEAAVNRRVGMQ